MFGPGSGQTPPMRVHHDDVLRYRPGLVASDEAHHLLGGPLAAATGNPGLTSSPQQPPFPDGTAPGRPLIDPLSFGTPSADNQGQVMEYSAGVIFREQVLQPVLKNHMDNDETPPKVQTEATRFLCIYSRGELLFLKHSNGDTHQASMEHVTALDASTLASWWDGGDRTLSYTSIPWSQWWVSRCHLRDTGCEMIKLVNRLGEILGVAYFERSVTDRYEWGGENRAITLIRGIRLNPSLNPEAQKRGSLLGGTHHNTFEPSYRGIASLLFCHIIFASVRYGSRGVGVNCPKNDIAETFYESFMGPAQAFDEETGRRYYRIDSGQRWKILQQGFRRQVELWSEERERGETSEPMSNGLLSAAAANGEADSSSSAKRQRTKIHVSDTAGTAESL